ncbi:hypothetical protein B0H15DRAFT_944532 [Mycena belliarum]|uniref:Uncharacterized protein n=1 Tax=Mycena belliarum TaxID=1033014 RepID=A0AAD6Y032_9AGAR|nr:hypothetical protein B0H15DRAFT_944532 [Mycena belliae]
MPHINFPQARYYQTKIQAYFPAQAQRGSARISTPSVREGRTRVLLPGSGTEAMRIDVDDWDALDAIYVAGSDEETETTEGPPNLPKASASDVDVVSLFECCVCLDTYHRPVVTTFLVPYAEVMDPDNLRWEVDAATLQRLVIGGWQDAVEACDPGHSDPLRGRNDVLKVYLVGEVVVVPEEYTQTPMRLGLPNWQAFGWPATALLPLYMEQMRILHALQRQARREAKAQGCSSRPRWPLSAEFEVLLVPYSTCYRPGRHGLWDEYNWEETTRPFSRGETVMVNAIVFIAHDTMILKVDEVQRVHPSNYTA